MGWMSRAFRCDALDTPQGYISNTKKSHKNKAMEIWDIWAKMGPSRAPGDQIWSQLPPIGLPGLDSWSPLTLTWYWVPSGSPGSQKGPILAQMSQISMAPFLWDIFCVRNIALWGCPEHHNGTPCSSSTVTAHMEPSSLRKRSKTNPMGQNTPFLAQLRFQTT